MDKEKNATKEKNVISRRKFNLLLPTEFLLNTSCCIRWRTTTCMYKNIIRSSSFSFYGKVMESVEDIWNEDRTRYESSVNRYFFFLLSWEWYRATSTLESAKLLLPSLLTWVWHKTITRHRNILFSTRISTFTSLVRLIWKHQLVLVLLTSLLAPVWYSYGFSLPLNPEMSGTRLKPRAA